MRRGWHGAKKIALPDGDERLRVTLRNRFLVVN
jgi:hypothetical protein